MAVRWIGLVCCATLIGGPALAQERTPQQMMAAAYGKLMNQPGVVDNAFWAPERWYTRHALDWITAYESCRRASAPIWHNGAGLPKLKDVDITPVPPIGDNASVLVSLKNAGRAEQRIFFFRRENGVWRINNVMASGGKSLNTNQPACRQRGA